MIRFYNTLTGRLEEFVPLEPGRVKLYTCGPTVYDYAHIGNFRAYIFEDLLKRFLLAMGFKVTHVMNITDVDDKTIRGARAKNLSLQAYTQTYIDAFFEDIDTLKILRADYYPRATEHIPDMVKMIQGLMAKGYAYEKDGSIYYDVSKFPEYGKLSKIKISELKTGVRIDADEYTKDSVQDFALWKKRKEGEPYWETELGPGRPGWHIECSVMSSKYLGETFDIHCGGVDNIFPHHENEIAQSEAYTGKKFVNYWLHCHHLIVEGEKMSKSKGNFYTLRDLIAKGIDPLDLRYLLLATHYRKMLNFTFDGLHQAEASRRRIYDFIYELTHRTFPPGETEEIKTLTREIKDKFFSSLSDDLNISLALTALFELIKKGNIFLAQGLVKSNDQQALQQTLLELDKVLAILPPMEEEPLPPEILKKIEARQKARATKNYALADKIRDELRAQGILLEDTKEGVRWKLIKLSSK
jgi:cysteinyl-tRNA synthetase